MNEFKHVIEKMAGDSLRCVAFGFRRCDVKKIPVSIEQRKQWVIPDDELALLAIVGIKVSSDVWIGKILLASYSHFLIFFGYALIKEYVLLCYCCKVSIHVTRRVAQNKNTLNNLDKIAFRFSSFWEEKKK